MQVLICANGVDSRGNMGRNNEEDDKKKKREDKKERKKKVKEKKKDETDIEDKDTHGKEKEVCND